MNVGETNKLEGIFTPLLVPLDERDRVNEVEFRRFVSWLIERGVHGVYPNGSMGEFTRFTAEERRPTESLSSWGRTSAFDYRRTRSLPTWRARVGSQRLYIRSDQETFSSAAASSTMLIASVTSSSGKRSLPG